MQRGASKLVLGNIYRIQFHKVSKQLDFKLPAKNNDRRLFCTSIWIIWSYLGVVTRKLKEIIQELIKRLIASGRRWLVTVQGWDLQCMFIPYVYINLWSLVLWYWILFPRFNSFLMTTRPLVLSNQGCMCETNWVWETMSTKLSKVLLCVPQVYTDY